MTWFILGMIIGANFGALMMAVVQMNRQTLDMTNPFRSTMNRSSWLRPHRAIRR
jgi:hypothetical protein